MDFEEALTAELEQIEGLMDKVFPLNAEEGTEAPYLIYVGSEGLEDKTLDGYSDSKEIDCELNIMQYSYSGLKYLTKQVLSKVKSFQSRKIGDDGPFIQNISYNDSVEIYEKEVDLYRCVIEIKVKIGGS